MDIATLGTVIATSGAVSALLFFWLKERLRQSIRHEYERDIAKLRSELDFDLDRRKRLYEGKLAQYKRYFAMLDGYSERIRCDLFERFQGQFIALIRDPSEESTIAYVRSSISLQGDLAQKFSTFKSELNGLRLEAGENMLRLLDLYIAMLEPVQEQTVGFIQWMNSNHLLFVTDPDAANAHVQGFLSGELSNRGAELTRLQGEIFQEMRRELGVA